MAIVEIVISGTGYLIPSEYDGLLNNVCITIKVKLANQLGKTAKQKCTLG